MTNTRRSTARQRISVAPGIRNALDKSHFAHVNAASYRLADDLVPARQRLFHEWNELEPDNYLHDDATFRRRRFSLFYFSPTTDELLPLPPSYYFQASDINSYAGGLDRRFAPLSPSALRNEFLHELIRLLFQQLPIEQDRRSHPWLVDVHQIRITATREQQGEPAPEGPHHDGEEFGVVHLVERRNVVGGVNLIYSNEQELLSSRTLHEPMDTLLLWDPHVMHDVSPIRPADPDQPALRDTLLIGYDPQPQLERPT